LGVAVRADAAAAAAESGSRDLALGGDVAAAAADGHRVKRDGGSGGDADHAAAHLDGVAHARGRLEGVIVGDGRAADFGHGGGGGVPPRDAVQRGGG